MYKLRNGRRVKTITGSLLQHCGASALAYWFMDDGCIQLQRNGRRPDARFYTQGFEPQDVVKLSEYLSWRWGIQTTLCPRGNSFFLLLGSKATEKLLPLIKGTVEKVPCMAYKILESCK
jgi:hypothetical protein